MITLAKQCSFCIHKDRESLERALLEGSKTQQQVANILGVNRSSISRHMKAHTQNVKTDTDGKRLDALEKQLIEVVDRVSTLEPELKEHRMWGGHRRC